MRTPLITSDDWEGYLLSLSTIRLCHYLIILVLLASIWRECFQWWLQSENDWYLRFVWLIQWPDVSSILSCFLIDYLAWRRIDRGISGSHHFTFAAKSLSDTVLVKRRCLPRTCSCRCRLKLINDHNFKNLISVRQCLLPASFLILTYVVRNQHYPHRIATLTSFCAHRHRQLRWVFGLWFVVRNNDACTLP